MPPARLDAWLREVGWETLVNRRGTSWRKLDPTLQSGVRNDASARSLMLAHVSVIKRPVVEWSGKTTVGFDPGAWALLKQRG